MPNMMDYLAAYGHQSFRERPYQVLDSLLLANMCYNKLGPLAATVEGMSLRRLAASVDLSPFAYLPYHKERKALLEAMGVSERFGDALACVYTDVRDNTLPLQFSALVVRFADFTAVCYRGTDNTLTGWREDLHMSFESPVPGQTVAVRFLTKVAELYPGPLIVTGHSKGGNLAAYAASHAGEEIRARIQRVDCFDGPGLDQKTLQSSGYAQMRSLIHSYIPQNSVIGLLLGTDYPITVVHSTAQGLQQHDCFSWTVEDDSFRYLEHNSVSSQFTDRTLDKWLETCTPEQRRICVDAIFDLLDATDANTLAEMKADPGRSAKRILQAARGLDGETLLAFLKMAAALVQSSAGSAVDMVQASQFSEQLRPLTEQVKPWAEQLRGLADSLADKSVNAWQRLQQALESAPAPAKPSIPTLNVPNDPDEGGIPHES